MNWDAIGAIAELIGAAAVVVTLAYLAAQTRTNTAAVNRATTQTILQGRAQASQFIAGDEAINDLLWKGADTPDSLSDKEWQRFLMIVSAVARPLELAYLDHVNGRTDEQLWIGQYNNLKYWFTRPGLQRWLDEYGDSLHGDFVAYVRQFVIQENDRSKDDA
jgi:ABC-type nitrate/sulfonate/bicarbonate transport system substrate-binding protein